MIYIALYLLTSYPMDTFYFINYADNEEEDLGVYPEDIYVYDGGTG